MLTKSHTQVDARETRIEVLTANLKDGKEELGNLRRQVSTTDRDRSTQQVQINALEARCKETATRLQAATVRFKDADTRRVQAERLLSKSGGAPSSISTQNRLADKSPAPQARIQDDLQTITGIGPGYAADLNQAGIRSYADLARFARAKGAEDLADLVDVDAARIRRDKWAHGAKVAHKRKYKEQI
jgi:predicted flap endonuclease-1-like 5' DNA nuclease